MATGRVEGKRATRMFNREAAAGANSAAITADPSGSYIALKQVKVGATTYAPGSVISAPDITTIGKHLRAYVNRGRIYLKP